jgi:hypothetical protein
VSNQSTLPIAVPAVERPAFWASESLRQFAGTAVLTGALIGLFWLVDVVEPAVHHRAGIVGARPVSVAAVLAGLAHFSVAFFYTITSRAWGSRQAVRRFFLGMIAAVALCGVLAIGSDLVKVLFPSVFVGIYFIAHEVRDEYFFTTTLGDVPAGRLDRRAFLMLLGAVYFALNALIWNIPFVRPDHRGIAILRPIVDLSEVQGAARAIWWAGPPVLLGAAAVALFSSCLRQAKMSLGDFFRTYSPLLVIYAILASLLFLAPKKEQSIYMIVCFHVAAWWVFTARQLARRDRAAYSSGIAWFRETQAGFQTLHIALLLFFIGLAAVWAYGFDRSLAHPLGWLVSREAFPYWTICHVTVSFVPKASVS